MHGCRPLGISNKKSFALSDSSADLPRKKPQRPGLREIKKNSLNRSPKNNPNMHSPYQVDKLWNIKIRGAITLRLCACVSACLQSLWGTRRAGTKSFLTFFSFLVEVLDSVQGAASLTARSRPAPQPAGEDHTSLKNLGYWTVGTSPRLPLGDELACFCGEITARARCAASCAVPRSSRIRTARSPGGSTAGCWALRRKRPPQNKVNLNNFPSTHTHGIRRPEPAFSSHAAGPGA